MKEVDFARSLLAKQHKFNGTSLEVNNIRQSFYLGRHAQQKFVSSCLQEAREIIACVALNLLIRRRTIQMV